MTNLSSGSDHNILGCGSSDARGRLKVVRGVSRSSEAGYTLVALLALMTVLALFAMAVAPSMYQQSQREKEKEAIFRGEQIAEAIREYYIYRSSVSGQRGDQALPSSMDQLLQGLPIPGGAKTRQILRASAAHDPLTLEGEWRYIHPRSEALIDFQQNVMTYAGTTVPVSKNQLIAALQALAAPQMAMVIDTGTKKTGPSSSAADDSSGPFVGVASRSRRDSVITYYGIETHDGWVFTPLFRGP